MPKFKIDYQLHDEIHSVETNLSSESFIDSEYAMDLALQDSLKHAKHSDLVTIMKIERIAS